MKIFALAFLSALASCAAFAPSVSVKQSTVILNAESEQSRKAFLSAAAASVFGVAVAPAFAMDQDNVDDPTEQWETGSPTASAESARMARYTNARTQMTSNFAPIKRLTLERKSPVVRFVCECSHVWGEVACVLWLLLLTDLCSSTCALSRLAWTSMLPLSMPTRRPTRDSSLPLAVTQMATAASKYSPSYLLARPLATPSG